MGVRDLFLVLALCFWMTGLSAQKNTGYAYVSRTMSHIPDSLTYSTHDLADYINSKFMGQRDKSRAIFVWIARNIEYNFDSILTNSIYETPPEVSERILRTRTGVCLNFAMLFNELANKTGIRSYVIQGYTKQEGRVDYLPHLWCGACIDSVWFLFDPTWGSGYYSHGRYIQEVNGSYFMVKPEVMIHSHMPFDPMWQFLNYPVTSEEFYKGIYRVKTDRPYFNFVDSLNTYDKASELERAVSSARRVERNGVKNSFTAAKLRVLKGEIDYYRNKIAAEKYDSAVNQYNSGIQVLNQYIQYRNQRTGPGQDSMLLSRLLDSTEYLFNTALKTLANIQDTEDNITITIFQLRNAINRSKMILNEQRSSFKQYLKNRKW